MHVLYIGHICGDESSESDIRYSLLLYAGLSVRWSPVSTTVRPRCNKKKTLIGQPGWEHASDWPKHLTNAVEMASSSSEIIDRSIIKTKEKLMCVRDMSGGASVFVCVWHEHWSVKWCHWRIHWNMSTVTNSFTQIKVPVLFNFCGGL